MKKCSTCKVNKPFESFSKCAKTKDKHQSDCKLCRQEWKLKHKYGISNKERDTLYAKQKGLCCICNTFFLSKNLVVDHCHTSGKIRGLLCSPCNRGIGLLKDNPDILYRGFKYLLTSNPDQGE